MSAFVAMLALAASSEMTLPKDYREWVFMSSGLGMTYGPAAAMAAENPMWDNVFVKPESWRTFKETGKWPDGTTFILEIRYATSQGSINKGGHYQTDIAAIEMSVKSGDEWNYYNFGNTMRGLRESTAPLPKSAGCVACHSANGATEWTFTQFYPAALEIAQKKGTVKASYQPPVGSPAVLFHTIRDGGWTKGSEMLAAAKTKDPSAPILKERVLNGIGYSLLTQDRTQDAVAVLRYVTQVYPQSADAYDSLAEALEKAGDAKGAVESSKKCLQLAVGNEQLVKVSNERINRLAAK